MLEFSGGNIRNLRCATRFCIRLLSSGSVTSDHSVSCTLVLLLLAGEEQSLFLLDEKSGLYKRLSDLWTAGMVTE